ncbi:hypothetical protein UFOVP327_1, partial [uncultured Caudovirales phage]
MNLKISTQIYLVLKTAITTVLLPIVTANTWIFTVLAAGILFVGNCINQPLLYIL